MTSPRARRLAAAPTLVVCLAASSCGDDEWVCDNSSVSLGSRGPGSCDFSWICEGPGSEFALSLRVECTMESGVTNCTCAEQENSSLEGAVGPTFEATEAVCEASAESTEEINRGCGWAVPEMDR